MYMLRTRVCFKSISISPIRFSRLVLSGGGYYFISPNAASGGYVQFRGDPHESYYIDDPVGSVSIKSNNHVVCNMSRFKLNKPVRNWLQAPASGKVDIQVGGVLSLQSHLWEGIYTGILQLVVHCQSGIQLVPVPIRVSFYKNISVIPVTRLRFGEAISGNKHDIRVRPSQPRAADILIKGPNNADVKITLSSKRIIALNPQHQSYIIINRLRYSNNVQDGVLRLSSFGSSVISLGGTAHVLSTSPPGRYRGSVDINVTLLQ